MPQRSCAWKVLQSEINIWWVFKIQTGRQIKTQYTRYYCYSKKIRFTDKAVTRESLMDENQLEKNNRILWFKNWGLKDYGEKYQLSIITITWYTSKLFRKFKFIGLDRLILWNTWNCEHITLHSLILKSLAKFWIVGINLIIPRYIFGK